jgi:hypothetical protein
VDVLTEDGVVEDFLEGEVVTIARGDGVGRSLRVHGDTAGFVEVNVGTGVEDNGVGRLGEVGADGELVGLWKGDRGELMSKRGSRRG